MSENIESNLRKFNKGKHLKGFTHTNFVIQAEAATEMSNFARKSEITKLSKVAEVSAPIPVGDTSRAISSFAIAFDRLYASFSEQIVKEYEQMRNNYMNEYQSNYDMNTSRKGDRISEVSTEIEN